jgi:hypothetical protein
LKPNERRRPTFQPVCPTTKSSNLVGWGGAPYVAIWPMRSVLLGAINTDADDVAPHLNQPSYLTCVEQ